MSFEIAFEIFRTRYRKSIEITEVAEIVRRRFKLLLKPIEIVRHYFQIRFRKHSKSLNIV